MDLPTAQAGEIYAGIAFDEEGKPSHHLFLLEAKPDKRLKWKAAVTWAKKAGGELPSRFESALLYANLRGQFDTSTWYWTGTQCSADDAWGQYFYSGSQYGDDKSYEGLARAVRRLPL